MSLRRNARGQYVARWYEDGTKQSRYLQRTLDGDYEDARKEYKRLLASATTAREKKAKRGAPLSFRELAARYLEVKGAKMSAGGRERAAEIIAAWGPLIGAVKVADLTPIDIETAQQQRITDGKIAPATVNREWNTIRAALNWGEKTLGIRNPIVRGVIEPRKLKGGGAKITFFEPEEWRAFITAFDDVDVWREYVAGNRRLGPVSRGESERYLTARRFGGGRRPESVATIEQLERLRETLIVFYALLYTGGRLGAVLALQWRDVDLRRDMLTLADEKGQKTVTIPLAADLRRRLPQKGAPDDPVFGRGGRPFYIQEVQRAFNTARDVAKLPAHLTPHSLRHTTGSWLAQSGESLLTIQKLLGHASPVITAKYYAHLMPTHLRSAVESVAATASGNVQATSQENGACAHRGK